MIPNEPYKNATYGEKRLFYLMGKLLPQNYIVWAELRINEKYPDFVIVGPDIGVMVLEVKDWSIYNTEKFDKDFVYFKKGEPKVNPLQQARNYNMKLLNKLKKDLDGDATEQQQKLDSIIDAASQIKDIIKKMGNVRHYITKPYLKGVDIVDFSEAAEE